MDWQFEVERLLRTRRGHFRLESGHHGEMWLELEALYLRPSKLTPLVDELARRIEPWRIDTICGPLVEGAFVGLGIAERIDAEFVYAERRETPKGDQLYPFEYRIPDAVRDELKGRRAAIANDVINAGSAVGGAASDLQACGAELVGVAALLVLGDWTAEFVGERGIPSERLAWIQNSIWPTESCPLCERGEPLSS